MSPSDAMTMMLLVAHFLALGVAVVIFLWILFLQRRNRAMRADQPAGETFFPGPSAGMIRPTSWLAVRSVEPSTVRAALPDCERFSVSPRVNGWVIVTGPGLPDPGDDVDGCFRFLIVASRHLGHVQFFQMEKFSGHHAWARMDDGCVTRAYAWAGETVWTQGAWTTAERELGMACHGYGEDSVGASWTTNELAAANVEKIPLLAARWSLDPEVVQRAEGGLGESSSFY